MPTVLLPSVYRADSGAAAEARAADRIHLAEPEGAGRCGVRRQRQLGGVRPRAASLSDVHRPGIATGGGGVAGVVGADGDAISDARTGHRAQRGGLGAGGRREVRGELHPRRLRPHAPRLGGDHRLIVEEAAGVLVLADRNAGADARTAHGEERRILRLSGARGTRRERDGRRADPRPRPPRPSTIGCVPVPVLST